LPLNFSGVVDLPNDLMCLIDVVDVGQAHAAWRDFELRHDGATEGFGGDAGAIGKKKHGSVHNIVLNQLLMFIFAGFQRAHICEHTANAFA
jgi:hypothetical protein